MGESFMAYHPDPYVRNYEDRGMAKWLGFYLSEHTAEMEKDTKSRNTFYARKEKMDEDEISKILGESYTRRVSVILQLASLNSEGFAFADIEGVVEGFKENDFYISNVETGLQIVALDSINHVMLSDQEKWSEIS